MKSETSSRKHTKNVRFAIPFSILFHLGLPILINVAGGYAHTSLGAKIITIINIWGPTEGGPADIDGCPQSTGGPQPSPFFALDQSPGRKKALGFVFFRVMDVHGAADGRRWPLKKICEMGKCEISRTCRNFWWGR